MKDKAEELKQAMQSGGAENPLDPDDEMRLVLDDFRMSVHAWSEAAYHRPRKISAAEHRVWRRTLAWALGCVMAVGVLLTGIYPLRQKSQPEQTARVAVVQAPEEVAKPAVQTPVQAPVQVAVNTQEDESWMTKVDSDVSRQVPAAMEPLAQLLNENESE